MRRSLLTFAGLLLLGLSLALSAPGVELQRCDASRQSCASSVRPRPTRRTPTPSTCQAHPPEVDVRAAEAAVDRARQALAHAATGPPDVVSLNGSGYNYAPASPQRR